MFEGLVLRVVELMESVSLMAYQNFLTRKYHCIVKANIIKFRTKPLMANYLIYTVSRPNPVSFLGVPIRSSMHRNTAARRPLKSA